MNNKPFYPQIGQEIVDVDNNVKHLVTTTHVLNKSGNQKIVKHSLAFRDFIKISDLSLINQLIEYDVRNVSNSED